MNEAASSRSERRARSTTSRAAASSRISSGRRISSTARCSRAGRVRTGIGEIEIAPGEELRAGERVVLSVRPEDVELTEARGEGANVWEARVDQKVFLGSTTTSR